VHLKSPEFLSSILNNPSYIYLYNLDKEEALLLIEKVKIELVDQDSILLGPYSYETSTEEKKYLLNNKLNIIK
jgi:hypothetical protein